MRKRRERIGRVEFSSVFGGQRGTLSERVFDLAGVDNIGAQAVAVERELEGAGDHDLAERVQLETDRCLQDVVVDTVALVVVVAEKVAGES